MALKWMVAAAVVCAGLTINVSSASAQDWWNPGRWFSPKPAYAYTPAYNSSCPGGVCRPNGYTAGYCPNGNCGAGTCGPMGCRNGWCRNGSCGNRAPVYAPATPGYRSGPPADYFNPTPVSNYRGSVSRGPFYE